jgi:hypothetical protein
VPFVLGRPLGVPNDSDFQNRVIVAALKLLEAPDGPVLKDFPEDAPLGEADQGLVACPVDFSTPKEALTDRARLLSTFREEAAQMKTWYDLAIKNRGRTTAGSSGLSPEQTMDFIVRYIKADAVDNPLPDILLGSALKLAVEDLKSYYLEAVTNQPGQPTDSKTLSDWFWGQTAAAQVINKVRETCMASNDKKLALAGKILLIPREQLHRFEG